MLQMKSPHSGHRQLRLNWSKAVVEMDGCQSNLGSSNDQAPHLNLNLNKHKHEMLAPIESCPHPPAVNFRSASTAHLLAILDVAWSFADRSAIGDRATPVTSAQVAFSPGLLAAQVLV